MPDLFDEIERQIVAHHARTGERLRDEVRAAVGDVFPPASRPGEYPAKRSGNLQSKITTETRVEGDRVVTSIRSGAHYSAKLVESGRLLLNGLAEKWRAAASAIRFTRG
jgi:hypothetical protein